MIRVFTSEIYVFSSEIALKIVLKWKKLERKFYNDLPVRSGRTTSINLDELKQAIEADPTLSTRNEANKVGCSQYEYAVRYHYNKLQSRSTLGGWASHQLTPEQKKKRVQACEQAFNISRRADWLNKLVTEDEKWALHVNIERRCQWLKPVPVNDGPFWKSY